MYLSFLLVLSYQGDLGCPYCVAEALLKFDRCGVPICVNQSVSWHGKRFGELLGDAVWTRLYLTETGCSLSAKGALSGVGVGHIHQSAHR